MPVDPGNGTEICEKTTGNMNNLSRSCEVEGHGRCGRFLHFSRLRPALHERHHGGHHRRLQVGLRNFGIEDELRQPKALGASRRRSMLKARHNLSKPQPDFAGAERGTQREREREDDSCRPSIHVSEGLTTLRIYIHIHTHYIYIYIHIYVWYPPPPPCTHAFFQNLSFCRNVWKQTRPKYTLYMHPKYTLLGIHKHVVSFAPEGSG